MCYSGARLVNEGLSLPSPYVYLHPPPPVEEEFIPDLPRIVEELSYFVPAMVVGPSLFEQLL